MSRPGRAARAAFGPVALLTVLAMSGCGSASSGTGGGTGVSSPPGSATSGTPVSASASASAPSGPVSTGAPSTAPSGPASPGGPVPRGFAATSVTFVSPEEGFVLGTAPCPHAACTSILRTLDRGVSWRGLPAPAVPRARAGEAGPAVWGLRFADPNVGFAFGHGLWETTDGGAHWNAAVSPGGSILSLEVTDGQVLALTATCGQTAGCAQTGTLLRRALSGGAWQVVARVADPRSIATQVRVAAVADGGSVIVTTDGGLTSVTRATPCGADRMRMAMLSSVAVTGPDGLALLCAGEAGTGSVDKAAYLSDDLGAHWTEVGSPPRGGDPESSSAATSTQLVVAASSGASELYYSGDGGVRWSTAYFVGDGGMGFNDLGFTTAADGVVIHAPALSDRDAEGRSGQLLLSGDGGASWRVAAF